MTQTRKLFGWITFLSIFCLLGTEALCQSPGDALSIGIGPITKVELGAIDSVSAAKGKEIFTSKCSACHKIEERYVGPALAGVTKRRAPEWIMNMIMNPQEMTQKDPIAQELLGEYLAQMATLNLSETDTRAVLEYLRQVDAK